MTTIIYGETEYKNMQNMLNLPKEIQQIYFYTQKITPFSFASKKETDNHIYWSFSKMKPLFENKKLFYVRKTQEGATYTKSTKTLKLWYNKSFNALSYNIKRDLYVTFKLDWVLQMKGHLQECMTLPILNRILKNKITNPREFCKAYIKTNFKGIELSPELFYKTFGNTDVHYLRHPMGYRYHFMYATKPNNVFKFLDNYSSDASTIINDVITQAAALNRKYNPDWSNTKFREVHTEWTRELMKLELDNLPIVEYHYQGALPVNERLSLITNNLELFEEGTIMQHCVYTNYSEAVKRHEYFVMKYHHGNVRATVGIKLLPSIESDKRMFYVQQMYSVRNSNVPDEDQDFVNEWLKQPAVQEYFMKNHKEIPWLEKSTNELGFVNF